MTMWRKMLFAALAAGLTTACGEGGGGGVQLVPGQRSPWSVQGTALAIMSPAHGDVVQNPVRVQIMAQGFEAGAPTVGAAGRGIAMSAQGQHVHVIVDNEAYQAVYDLDQPFELPELTPGPHTIRAFPARQWHESVKAAGAFETVQFYVGTGSGDLPLTPGAPLLTYSRPVGTYSGSDADSILVDFYVRNAEMGPNGHKVRLTVDGTTSETIAAWIPYFIVGLSAGEHTVRLELLDPAGRPVDGPYNATERVITVER